MFQKEDHRHWEENMTHRYYMYIYLFTDSKVHIYAHKPGMSPGNSRLEAHTDSQVYNITSV